MTEVMQAGPVSLSQVWIDDKIIARDVHGDDLVDVLQQNGNASAWAVTPREDTAALHRLTRMIGVDDATLSALLAPGRSIRFVDAGEIRLVRLHAVGHAAGELTVEDLTLIITDQVLIILADDRLGRRLAGLLSGAAARLARGSAERAAQVVVESVVAGLADSVEWIEDAGDTLAEDLFGGQPLSQHNRLQAFRLRRRLTELRRAADPTRTVLGELTQSVADSGVDTDDTELRHWTMITDHADRVTSSVAMAGESLTAIFDTSLALDGARENEVMKKLAGWAAIIAVPTLVTGFVGMNVSFWGEGSTAGFYLYLALMIISAVVLFALFRRNRWI